MLPVLLLCIAIAFAAILQLAWSVLKGSALVVGIVLVLVALLATNN